LRLATKVAIGSRYHDSGCVDPLRRNIMSQARARVGDKNA
jgi:hypothetical protein